jgi:hypothetical protein
MRALRDNSSIKYLWLFLVFLIFNYSIDVPDYYGDQVTEDLTYNDIESISELVLEVVLQIKDAVPEHDEDDPDENSGFAKKIDIQFFNSVLIKEKKIIYSIDFEHTFSIPFFFFENPYLNRQIKPPQA